MLYHQYLGHCTMLRWKYGDKNWYLVSREDLGCGNEIIAAIEIGMIGREIEFDRKCCHAEHSGPVSAQDTAASEHFAP